MSSESSPKPRAKHPRVRTESQLNQKRLADRNKHRENRQEQKQQLSSIKSDLSDIKLALKKLTADPPVEAPTTSHTPQRQQWNTKPPDSTLHLTKLWPQKPTNHVRLVNCQCGFHHFDRFDLVDVCSMTSLYQRQTAGPWDSIAIPRNPSLPSAMLHSTDENLATSLITGCLRQYKMKSIEQLLSLYLLGYRYMRWKMFPTAETMQDVPRWLWPTETQLLHPHSVVVDFLAWPKLRDYLCVSGDDDPRHSLGCYLESLEFLWPGNVPIFSQSEDGQIELSHDFQAAINNLDNWRLGSPWMEYFPHLAHLVVAE